jgi:hypothetical protein
MIRYPVSPILVYGVWQPKMSPTFYIAARVRAAAPLQGATDFF